MLGNASQTFRESEVSIYIIQCKIFMRGIHIQLVIFILWATSVMAHDGIRGVVQVIMWHHSSKIMIVL
jgi:hypothetical protein